MFKRSWVLCAALTLAAVAPGLAAPTMTAKVGHMCCGGCESAVKKNTAALPWVAGTETKRADNSVTVMAKDGMEVDAFALIHALQMAGFPPSELQLSGTQSIKMDVGHLCCGACVGPLKTALEKVSWIQSADVKPNTPVMLIVKPGMSANLTELLEMMSKAGYSASKLTVAG